MSRFGRGPNNRGTRTLTSPAFLVSASAGSRTRDGDHHLRSEVEVNVSPRTEQDSRRLRHTGILHAWLIVGQKHSGNRGGADVDVAGTRYDNACRRGASSSRAAFRRRLLVGCLIRTRVGS